MNESFPSSIMISDTDSTNSIIFEVPLTKQSRSFLRLERVFNEMYRHISIATPSAHFFALKQLFSLLDFFERGDFKAELIKELDREIAYFAKLESNPEVDISKLDTFIKQLKQLSHWFKNQKGKIGHQLLKQEFIANAKKKLTLPTARLSFDAPFVKLFLSMPADVRKEKLNSWLKVFKAIQTSVDVLLRLSRETAHFNTVFAEDGFYQQEMDKETYQFLGIKIPEDLHIYPEVSSSPKRFSIRFMTLSEDLEIEQFSNWLDFELAKYS
ncbi:MAG: cell division protein ZapD [Gammaproteobacteria bacterium]|nr:cell division protein ZapD [Gammaproteobacteria bacterium]